MKKKLLALLFAMTLLLGAVAFGGCDIGGMFPADTASSSVSGSQDSTSTTPDGGEDDSSSEDSSNGDSTPEEHTHVWNDGEITTEPTCTEMGVKTFTCTVCKTETYTEPVNPLTHDIEVHNPKTPTCMEIGWDAYATCKREGCNYSTYKELPATGEHTWDNGKVTTEPTCEEMGVKTFTCTVCKTESYTENVKPLTHDIKSYDSKKPTCAEIGWEAYAACQREGCNYSTYKELPATGEHNWDGLSCAVCGAPNDDYYTEGLVFELDEATQTYSVTGYTGTETDVIIPAKYNNLSVTSIATNAFYNCLSLTSVVIGNRVASIGDSAFFRCRSLTSITIPDSVTSIGDCAFYACNSLTSVVIPDSVTSIGEYAFYYCSSLTSVVIGDGVTSIGDRAFYDCNSLTSVVIGDSVTSIGEYAFYYCTSLTSVVIGDSVTSIGNSAFNNCTSLTSVVIPDSVTSIGDYAFCYCYNLTSVVIPDGVTSIGDRAFSYCSSLTSVVIPDGVTSIRDYAFASCDNLTSVVIGRSVTSIANMAFADCFKLVEVINRSQNIRITKGDWLNGYVGCYALAVYNSNDTFTGTKLSNDSGYIIYTDGEEKILVGYNGTELNLVLPSYITKINEKAFRNCDSLTSVVIGDSVTSIGQFAFEGCSGLTGVVISDSVTSIGDYAFSECISLTSIEVSGNNTTYQSIDGNLYTKDGKMIIQYAVGKTATSFVVPDGVTSIGWWSFYGCSSLTNVVIGDSVTLIYTTAFANCENLTSVVIGDSVTSIHRSAFSGCSSLTSVVIGGSVTSIGTSAFSFCSSLASVYYKSTAEEWAKISIGDSNDKLINATRYYYSESQPTEEGNYWHYVDGEIEIWELHIHTEVIDETVAPTCCQTGSTEGKHCETCGKILVEQEIIAMVAHSFLDGNCECCGVSAEIFYELLNVKDGSFAAVEYYCQSVEYNYVDKLNASIDEHSSACNSSECGLKTMQLRSAFESMCLDVAEYKPTLATLRDRIAELEHDGTLDMQKVNELREDVEELFICVSGIESNFVAFMTVFGNMPCNATA